MKVLFFFKSDFSSVPLGIMTLAAVLKKNGHECDFIDLKFEFNYINEIKKINPDVLAYSIVSFNWDFYQKINLEIRKQHNAFSIFGGPHCSVSPDMINEDGVDAICLGEGEFAFLELLDSLEKKQDITKIKNLWIKLDNNIYKNEVRELVSDLDSLPMPDYELVSKYPFFINLGMHYVMTSRGCPYNCPYCINHFFRKMYSGKGKYIRRRSVENVIEELLVYKNKYHAKLIVFNDDIFTLDKNWLEEFAPRYIESIGLPFEAYTRVDDVTEPVAELLAKMGCVAILIGIESGNPQIRYNVLKRKIDDQVIIDAAGLFKKNKIKTVAFNMLCLPGETLENAFETLFINSKCKINYPICFMFQPFPNIELTKFAIENNFYDGKTEVFHKSIILGKSIIQSKDKKKIARLHDLFIIGAKLPWTIPIIRLLIKLPLNFFYRFLLFFSKTIVLVFIIHRPSLKQYIKYTFLIPFMKLKSYF